MLALSKMWALRARWPLGIGGAVAVVVIAAIGWGLLQPSGRGAVAPEPAKPAPGTFRPTPAQLAGLKIMPVEIRAFRSEETTEGTIAIDDELTTPVFSPYSGRVTRLIAKLGDRVVRGPPLFAVEATEFVQAVNDLITAPANLKTARSQLNQAVTNEKRTHALYFAQGGALKDWQQSQMDLTNARNRLRSEEIALAAVRNRLRILGKTDRGDRPTQSASDATDRSRDYRTGTDRRHGDAAPGRPRPVHHQSAAGAAPGLFDRRRRRSG